ncbi:MAG: CGNR zinc finger domain-containing protein [Euzebyales bacterium]|nr:CGNR zinc finger domain-containing protein [Euzebyales bacterium]
MAEAPGGLEVVRRFVNTRNVEDGTDDLADIDGLAAFCREHGLAEDGEVTGADHDRAVRLREALRRVLVIHDGGPPDPEAVADLNQLAADAPLVTRLDDDAAVTLVPAAEGGGAVLARVLALVHAAEVDGTFARLKVCPADDCLSAFYDQSRNRSRTWCSMEVCGNRAKVRAYRARDRR